MDFIPSYDRAFSHDVIDAKYNALYFNRLIAENDCGDTWFLGSTWEENHLIALNDADTDAGLAIVNLPVLTHVADPAWDYYAITGYEAVDYTGKTNREVMNELAQHYRWMKDCEGAEFFNVHWTDGDKLWISSERLGVKYQGEVMAWSVAAEREGH